jgi:CBS domain-containing protein
MVTAQSLLDAKKHKGVISVKPTTLVYEALFIMNEANVGSLAVMEDEKLLGIFSERDYARKCVLLGRTSKKTTVNEIMHAEHITASPDTPLNELMETLTVNRIRHIPVMEEDKLVGILSIGDVVNSFVADQQWHIDMLKKFITT